MVLPSAHVEEQGGVGENEAVDGSRGRRAHSHRRQAMGPTAIPSALRTATLVSGRQPRVPPPMNTRSLPRFPPQECSECAQLATWLAAPLQSCPQVSATVTESLASASRWQAMPLQTNSSLAPPVASALSDCAPCTFLTAASEGGLHRPPSRSDALISSMQCRWSWSPSAMTVWRPEPT